MARASPTARVTVVLVVGARLKGQASRGMLTRRRSSLSLARELSRFPVMAMMGASLRLMRGMRWRSSSDSPE